MGDKATLIFPSKLPSGNPNREKELHCLTPELYSLVVSLEGRFYTTAGRESLLSSHLKEWEFNAYKYIRLSFCRRIQFLYLFCQDSRSCFTQGWRNSPLRKERTLLTERCCLWPSQWRTDKTLLLANRLVGPSKKNRMRAGVSLSLSNMVTMWNFGLPVEYSAAITDVHAAMFWRFPSLSGVAVGQSSSMEERRKDFCSSDSLKVCLI